AEETLRLCRDAGVTLLTNADQTVATNPAFLDNSAVFAAGLSQGTPQVKASVIIDTTGDATVAARAGVSTTMGRPADGAVMPLTCCYLIGPIDLDALAARWPTTVRTDPFSGERYCALSSHPEINAFVAEARKAGELSIARDHIAAILGVPGRPGVGSVNFGRVACTDPTDPDQ